MGQQIPLPVRALEENLSIQGNAFAMAGVSLSAIGFTYTVKKEYLSEESYASITSCLFLSVFLWFTVPIFFSGQLWSQTAVVLAATQLDVLAAISFPAVIIWRRLDEWRYLRSVV